MSKILDKDMDLNFTLNIFAEISSPPEEAFPMNNSDIDVADMTPQNNAVVNLSLIINGGMNFGRKSIKNEDTVVTIKVFIMKGLPTILYPKTSKGIFNIKLTSPMGNKNNLFAAIDKPSIPLDPTSFGTKTRDIYRDINIIPRITNKYSFSLFFKITPSFRRSIYI